MGWFARLSAKCTPSGTRGVCPRVSLHDTCVFDSQTCSNAILSWPIEKVTAFLEIGTNDSIKVYKQIDLDWPGTLLGTIDPASPFFTSKKTNQAALANFETGQVVNNSAIKNTRERIANRKDLHGTCGEGIVASVITPQILPGLYLTPSSIPIGATYWLAFKRTA